MVPFAGRHAPADAARVAALAARVALLERELQDSERTHALRCAPEQLPQHSCVPARLGAVHALLAHG